MNDYGELETGQLVWYEFHERASVLIVEKDEEIHRPLICNMTLDVTFVKYQDYLKCNKKPYALNRAAYDYIVLMDVLGKCEDAEFFLQKVYLDLKEDGILLLIANNKYGIRFFCGDYDGYTGMPYNGINDYPVDRFGKNYDKQGLTELLVHSGFKYMKFYYPLPDFRLLQVVYTDEIPPKEDFMERVIFCFEHTEALFADERCLYADIIRNGVFPFFSNSFIVEASAEKVKFCDISYAAVSIDRAPEHAFITAIHEKKRVTKRPIYEDRADVIHVLEQNMKALSKKGIPVLEAKYENEKIVMDYVTHPTLANHLRNLCGQRDKDGILEIFERLYQYILASSEETDAKDNVLSEQYEISDWGIILKKAFLELIPMNCFFIDGAFLFFDQEFVYDNFPALFVLFRGLRYSYRCISNLNGIISRQDICKHFGISDALWQTFEKEEQKLQIYVKQRKRHKTFYQNIFLDREEIYKRALLEDCTVREKAFNFDAVKKEQCVIFGAGKIAGIFIEKYGKVYRSLRLFDNEPSLWGNFKWGVKVENPKILQDVPPQDAEVVVCANNRNYIMIARQIETLGITDYFHYIPEK